LFIILSDSDRSGGGQNRTVFRDSSI